MSKSKLNNKNCKYLQLLQSETAPSTNLGIVPQGLRVHNGAERSSSRPGEDSHSLLLAHCNHQQIYSQYTVTLTTFNNEHPQ